MVTVHRCAETIRGWNLFTCGNYMTKYGILKSLIEDLGTSMMKASYSNLPLWIAERICVCFCVITALIILIIIYT